MYLKCQEELLEYKEYSDNIRHLVTSSRYSFNHSKIYEHPLS